MKTSRKRKASKDDDYCPSDEGSTDSAKEINEENAVDEATSSQPKRQRTDVNESYKSEFYFDKKHWSPLRLYRCAPDIVVDLIRRAGVEGIGRVEIGRSIGILSDIKTGNRRVSRSILQAEEKFPDHIGRYQKMEGKFRFHKFFYKAGLQPESFNAQFAEWTKICGTDCPFQIGQVIKFPGTQLSTLRISDVSLRRLIDIMRIVKEKRVVVALHRIHKMILAIEQTAGYKYQVDKKSVVKCVKALEKFHMAHFFIKDVTVDGVVHPVQVVCEWDINSTDHPEIESAVQDAINDFNVSGRIFPLNQIKCAKAKYSDHVSIKKSSPKVPEPASNPSITCDDKELIDKMTFDRRLVLFRKQQVKLATCANTAVEARIYGKKKDNEVSEAEKIDSKKTDEEVTMTVEELDQGNKSRDEHLTSEADPSVENENESQNLDELLNSANGKAEEKHPVNYGHQAKMMRCYVLHQLAWHFVYGLPDEAKPTVFERFPPDETNAPEGRNIKDVPVYIDDESPFRFVPPSPRFENAQRGWFMMCDLINSFPLSLFVLCATIKHECPGIEEYLLDPLKRHTLFGDLPHKLRCKLLKERDRRSLKQIEHLLYTLCGLGLMRSGENPDPKTFQPVDSQFFFVGRRGSLRDTSTSSHGYARVELPIEKYTKYDHVFDTLKDIKYYWHHFYAIISSTPLTYRSDKPEKSGRTSRKYTYGYFDKNECMVSLKEPVNEILPIGILDGCAGFDSRFFVHLKRHWELNLSPPKVVNWFISDWRRSTESAKDFVSERVQNLQKKWHSYMKTFMPSEFRIWNKPTTGNESTIRCQRLTVKKCTPKEHVKPTLEKKTASIIKAKKFKRRKDHIDILSEQRKPFMRSRFTVKERYMLIIIRAVGFFLNPVYRFWLDAAVIRDIMHEHVPESRSKTAQNLISAGVREMVRPERMTYLKKIVRSLTTFPEMRELRSKLYRNPSSGAKEKQQFFKDAFNTALRLLFKESHDIPPTKTSNEDFENFLRSKNVEISMEVEQNSTFPARSQKPTDVTSIQHCIYYNFVMSTMLQEDDTNDAPSGKILEQIDGASLSQLLERLRIDGIITRTRALSEDAYSLTRRRATFSYYFRHFFNHRYHPQLVEQTNYFTEDLNNLTAENQNCPGAIAACLKAFYSDEASLDLDVDRAILNAFQYPPSDEQVAPIKQCKYLDSTDLRLHKIQIQASTTGHNDNLPELTEIVDSLKRTIPMDLLNSIPFDDFLLNYSVCQRDILRRVHTIVGNSHIIGATLEDVLCIKESEIKVLWALNEMERRVQVVQVGVDCIRYVLAANSECWLARGEEIAFLPTHWTAPNGEIFQPVLRWMAEGIFFAIFCRPGVEVNQLKAKFCSAIQPRMLQDLLLVLERCGCIRIEHYFARAAKLASPFQKPESSFGPRKKVEYLVAVESGIERFARIFGSVKKSETFLSAQTELASHLERKMLEAIEISHIKPSINSKQELKGPLWD